VFSVVVDVDVVAVDGASTLVSCSFFDESNGTTW
jgi:hypothetical protein